MRTRKAFTLIELLIVIAVLSILVTIVIMSATGLQNDAKAAKVSGDLRIVKMAVESYATQNPGFPGTLPEALVIKSILIEMPKDEFNKTDDLNYSVSPDGKYYAIWSCGPDKTTALTIAWDGKTPIPADADDIGTTNGTAPNKNWN